MYQYLNWFHKGKDYPSGGKLLPHDQVNKLKATLLPSKVEVHESVQRYDGLGKVLFTPIYADFDSEESTNDVSFFTHKCKSEFGLTPDIYFSGNRGYHLFINMPVSHAYPHLVVRKFMSIMCDSKYLDEQMYTSRHLLRSEASIHFKTGLYKVRLPDVMSMDEARKLAKKQSLTQPTHHESRSLSLFLTSLYAMVDKEIKEADERYRSITHEVKDKSPCIEALINNGPVSGQNNAILTLIARNLNSIGVSLEDAIQEVAAKPEWMEYGKEIISIFKSTYKRPSRFGCKSNEILKQYCDPFCPFNELIIDI